MSSINQYYLNQGTIYDGNLSHKSRRLQFIEYRQQCIFRLRRSGLSLKAIGIIFNKHHSTILHHYYKYIDYNLYDVAYRKRTNEIDEAIKQMLIDFELNPADYDELKLFPSLAELPKLTNDKIKIR